MLHPAIIMQSVGTIHGRGLFTTEPIGKGTLLWQLDYFNPLGRRYMDRIYPPMSSTRLRTPKHRAID